MKESFYKFPMGGLASLESGKGPVAVFLHGAIAAPKAYIPLLNKLAADMTVIAPTHPGHGNSFPITDDWTVDAYVDIYKEFFRRRRIKPALLIGHSFGGMLALLLAPSFPKADVITCDPCGLPLSLTVKEYLSFMTREATDLVGSRPDLEVLRESIPAVGTLVSTVVRHPEDLVWFSEHVTRFDISHVLRTIRNRIAFIWGKGDAIVPVSVGERMHKLVPSSRFEVLEGAGHVYPVLDVDRTYGMICDVLRVWGWPQFHAPRT